MIEKRFDIARQITFALIGAGHMDVKHFTKAALLIEQELATHRNQSSQVWDGEVKTKTGPDAPC